MDQFINRNITGAIIILVSIWYPSGTCKKPGPLGPYTSITLSAKRMSARRVFFQSMDNVKKSRFIYSGQYLNMQTPKGTRPIKRLGKFRKVWSMLHRVIRHDQFNPVNPQTRTTFYTCIRCSSPPLMQLES